MGRKIHSISVQTSQEGIKCTIAKLLLSDLYNVHKRILESMTFDFEQNIQMILEGLTYFVATTERYLI